MKLVEEMMHHYYALKGVLPMLTLHPFAYLQIHGITDEELQEYFGEEEEEEEEEND